MTQAVFAAGMIAALLTTSTASAVTITNRDAKEVKLTVVEATPTGSCPVTWQGARWGLSEGLYCPPSDTEDDEYELQVSESVSVEEGFLFDKSRW